MSESIITLTDSNGERIEFRDKIIASGGMKDVYASPDKRYVVAFYRNALDAAARQRLEMITGTYRQRIFDDTRGDYWEQLFCWPTATVEYNGRVGIVAPFYKDHFFFEHGSFNGDMLKIQGKDKEGKWFASPNNQFKFLDARERGSWLNYLQLCLRLARAVRRLHAAGLAHSDLSYKNVLLAPTKGQVCIIDVDGLVVPDRFPPEVVGTPDFIAPECVASSHLPKTDPNRALPSILTDRHALAVMVYTLLLLRHPLRGKKVHAEDPGEDERLTMGAEALFVEHPDDASNRIDPSEAKPTEMPWKDPSRLPYTVTGPYLKALFDRAFIEGLHEPRSRPSADEWEAALIKTVDLIQPCQNRDCQQGWFVFDNTRAPRCPFCGTPYRGRLPVINLYSKRGDRYRPDNHRLMVYSNQSLFPWHIDRTIVPNERLAERHKSRVGYFVHHKARWFLVNEGMPALVNVGTGEPIPVGGKVELADGLQLLTGTSSGSRLLYLQLV
ncbi:MULTISPECIES: lipopolysaccharide kinase InaA family protein [unclassified Modicisalibacter]|uniref:helix-hairpin-helix domain-containing protein n=1 Tax=unclassified Modicisalibacter TaxID=2679913 RepID=UPI001CCC0B46|nr:MULTISPECIES: lipopolysaccharide kinase InaA family protein [unclassified Modicisalibacter]MBZ9559141.1 hypothetical protein [Modicisalibacter sp. R2A 31.J]MBZ9576694.1 hypothetical protein [Modicisalibacter sp. MOD 31.J]